MSGVFIRGEELQTDTRMPRADGGRDWSYAAAANHGTPKTDSQPLQEPRRGFLVGFRVSMALSTPHSGPLR